MSFLLEYHPPLGLAAVVKLAELLVCAFAIPLSHCLSLKGDGPRRSMSWHVGAPPSDPHLGSAVHGSVAIEALWVRGRS